MTCKRTFWARPVRLVRDIVLMPRSFFPLFSSYIYRLCSDIPSICYSTEAVLNDFETDGVVYLELRTTPRALPDHGIGRCIYVETILDCLKKHNSRPKARMQSNLILSIDRRMSESEADEIVDLAIKYSSEGVVAIDLCGDPSRGDVRIFSRSFKRAKAAGLKLTVHFAEAEASSSADELRTILGWNPDRLGHVIHVNDKIKAQIAEADIGVELCLSCNVYAKMIVGSYSDHHFGWWKDSGVGVALSVSPRWSTRFEN
jgi:adenosine deaminase